MTEATPPSEDQEQISSHQPFFLIGAERSGTTLLRLMLDHHPEIRCQFESSFYVDYLLDDGSEPPFEVLDKHIRMDRVARMSEFSLQPGLNFKETARAFLEEDAKRSGVRIYGATIHRRFRHILQVWPDARFVNLVRDPRDVAPSVIKMGWAGNTWHGSRLWAEAQQEAERLFDMVPKDRQLTLRFEDLVTTPVETFSRLCVFLGTSFQEAAMRYHEDSSYPPPDASAVERWRNGMTPRDVRLVEACVGGWLGKAGYQPSGLPPLTVRGLGKMRLGIQNRLGKIRFRMDRYGFPTVLSHALHRRLGNHRRSDALLLKMQERDNELLR